MAKPQELAYLIDLFHSLPGVGLKTAKRFAYFILAQDQQYVNSFVSRLTNAYQTLKLCPQCGNLTTKPLCEICTSPNRDQTKLLVVNNFEDLDRFEEANCYHGLYHLTFGEISNRKHITPDQLNLASLVTRIQAHPEIQQVIIGLSKTYDGIVTGEYIQTLLQPYGVQVFTIATGIPINASIDYADDETLKQAMNNKKLI